MRKHQSRRAFLATSGAVLAATLAGCTGDTEGGAKKTPEKGNANKDTTESTTTPESSTVETTTTTTTSKPSKDVELVKHEWTVIEEYEYGNDQYGVVGEVKNNGDVEYDIYIATKWLNSDGDVMGSEGIANVTLRPGQTGTFEVMYLGDEPDKVAEYEIDVDDVFKAM